MRYIQRQHPSDGSRIWLPYSVELEQVLADIPATVAIHDASSNTHGCVRLDDGPWVTAPTRVAAFQMAWAEFRG